MWSAMPSDEGGRGDKATIDLHLALDEDNGVRKRGGGEGCEQGGGGSEPNDSSEILCIFIS